MLKSKLNNKMVIKKLSLDKIGFSSRQATASLILVGNSFVWYLYVCYILAEITNMIKLNTADTLLLWAINFNATAISALVGAALTSKLVHKTKFLVFWMLFGILTSFAPILLDAVTRMGAFLISLLFGVAFGLGMPSSMAYFASNSRIENRARMGGIIYFLIGLGGVFLVGITLVRNVLVWTSILVAFRSVGLETFYITASHEPEINPKRNTLSYLPILRKKSFLLYFIPWSMFCLINYATSPIISRSLSPDFYNSLLIVEWGIVGVFALIGGFLSDVVGRKRVAIAGFVMIGLGYAALGVYPEGFINAVLYVVADGVAWGIFNTLFVMTLWGDLAYDEACDKYYALGGLPYLVSHLMPILAGSYIAEAIPRYAIFTFASFFLFLAVIPLMYAPETLPEKTIKDRELKLYIEQAKKTKEKYA